jgi:hypothetical protein
MRFGGLLQRSCSEWNAGRGRAQRRARASAGRRTSGKSRFAFEQRVLGKKGVAWRVRFLRVSRVSRFFDQPPPGYEHMTPMQFKQLFGVFFFLFVFESVEEKEMERIRYGDQACGAVGGSRAERARSDRA